MPLTVEERESIYQERKWVDASQLKWSYNSGAGREELTADVVLPTGELLTLRGWARKRFGFALFYRRTELIRRFDFSPTEAPDGNKLSGPHKQPCPEKKSPRWSYPVNDIPADNREKALLAFLKECNISIRGAYQISLF